LGGREKGVECVAADRRQRQKKKSKKEKKRGRKKDDLEGVENEGQEDDDDEELHVGVEAERIEDDGAQLGQRRLEERLHPRDRHLAQRDHHQPQAQLLHPPAQLRRVPVVACKNESAVRSVCRVWVKGGQVYGVVEGWWDGCGKFVEEDGRTAGDVHAPHRHYSSFQEAEEDEVGEDSHRAVEEDLNEVPGAGVFFPSKLCVDGRIG
jgi:hypothetical protein